LVFPDNDLAMHSDSSRGDRAECDPCAQKSSRVRPNSAKTFSWGMPSPRSREARAAAISRASSSETGSSSRGHWRDCEPPDQSSLRADEGRRKSGWEPNARSDRGPCCFSFEGAIRNRLPNQCWSKGRKFGARGEAWVPPSRACRRDPLLAEDADPFSEGWMRESLRTYRKMVWTILRYAR